MITTLENIYASIKIKRFKGPEVVAIRETHTLDFDFSKWIESLNLTDEQRVVMRKASNLVKHNIEKKDAKVPEAIRNSINTELMKLSSEIVAILLTLNMDQESLQVAVLYPAFEQGYVSKGDILDNFGGRILKLLMKVKDMEAIRFLHNVTDANVLEAQVDRVRRMMLAMVDDVRAVVVKLAERIAFIRSIDHSNSDDETRKTIAREISNIYAPLANRLGIGQLKWELEDLAFKLLNPESYKEIAKSLGERRVDREKYIENFVQELKDLLNKENIHAEVYGRPKHIYSIWRKMQRKHLEFSGLYDVRAVRVLVDSVEDCYSVLGIVHTRWRHIQKEFDDYIAKPKANGYQSIHTVVYGDGDKVVEIQIRTESMHNSAENGIAAHWKYKEGSSQSSGVEQRINWLRKLLSWRDDLVESGSLLSEFKKQVFEDRIYVFTPRAEVIDLPTGSTPLDFAYNVHTMVGHRCIGAKVDGHIVPFTYKLKTGEQVEIITQKNPNPSRDWLNVENGFLKTAKARNKVQSYFRKLDYDQNLLLGSTELEKELSKRSLNISKERAGAFLKEALPKYNLKSVNDLYASIGAGDINVSTIASNLAARLARDEQDEVVTNLDQVISDKTADTLLSRKSSGIVVGGVDNLMTHLAKCCQPIPGDQIAGFITQGRGISVHRCDCEQFKELQAKAPDRIVPASWGDTGNAMFSVTVRVIGQDYPGFLRDVTTVISNEKINISGARTHVDHQKDVSIIDLDLVVRDTNAFEITLKKLGDIRTVESVTRI